MKKIGMVLCLIGLAAPAWGENFTLGVGPVGQFFVVDSRPELGPGVGGTVFIDYRWSPQLSTQFGVMVSTEDGKGSDNGDKGIEFLGIPTFDVKYYLTYSK